MTLKVTRSNDDNKGIRVLSDNGFGFIVVCSGLTRVEHKETLRDIERELQLKCKSDIFFARNLASVYIFDPSADEPIDKETIRQLLPGLEYRVIYNGAIYGKQLHGLIVTQTRDEIKISKKFSTLLTMHKED